MKYKLIKQTFPKGWEPILQETCEIANRTVEEFEESPFQYSELTLCGLIASAANTVGCLALCEMWAEKSKQANGYLDLLMRVNGRSLWVEAKVTKGLSACQDWRDEAPKTISTGLKIAIVDANKVLGEAEHHAGDVYALVFTPLYMTRQNYADLKTKSARRDKFDNISNRLFDAQEPPFTHAALIADTRDLSNESWYDTDYDEYPVGIILTMEPVANGAK